MLLTSELNPFFVDEVLPPFQLMTPENIKAALETALKNYEKTLNQALENKEYKWENLVWPLELCEKELHYIWNILLHLNLVQKNDLLQKLQDYFLPVIIGQRLRLLQNNKLYLAYCSLLLNASNLTSEQTRAIKSYIKDFEHIGIHLENLKQKRVKKYCYQIMNLEELYKKNNTNLDRSRNLEMVVKIVNTRKKIAHLMGYSNFCEYTLSNKSIRTKEQVINFLKQIFYLFKPNIVRDLAYFDKVSAELGYKNKKNRDIYTMREEEIRTYFPETAVLTGMFNIIKKLFNLEIKPSRSAKLWNTNAECYQILDKGKILGFFYIDLYADPSKQPGAWTSECKVRLIKRNKTPQLPVVFIVTNFLKIPGKYEPLLSHNDIIILFHEFGHTLQKILTTLNCSKIGGDNGVPLDLTEVVSQFMESFCYEKEVLILLSKHEITGKNLPEDLTQILMNSKNFQIGLRILKQIELSLFDILIHSKKAIIKQPDIFKILNKIAKELGISSLDYYDLSLKSLQTIFSSGFESCYYTYLWSEVIAADLFYCFKQNGLFNPKLGKRFLTRFIQKIGLYESEFLITDFLNRKPDPYYLFKKYQTEEC